MVHLIKVENIEKGKTVATSRQDAFKTHETNLVINRKTQKWKP